MGTLPVTKLTLEYDGSDFSGWAKQPGRRTVQEELEAALTTVVGRPVELSVAGRTDRGVHALGQVASYRGPVVNPQRINSLIGRDVAIKAVEAMPDEFDARRSARSRLYCYRVVTRPSRSVFARTRALHWPYPLSVELLNEAAQELVGLRDFTAFTPSETTHSRLQRRVYQALWRSVPGQPVLEFWIEANAFVWQMNRVLVGTMLEVARGKRSLVDFVELLAGAPRSAAGKTAAPGGLYLVSVNYGEPAGSIPTTISFL